ncbi:MAG: lysostaphin resistance A-like protein [Gemmatimonadota bacterium]
MYRFLLKGPEVSWGTLAVVAALVVLTSILLNNVLYSLPWPETLARATHGWVRATLVGSGLMFVLVVGLGILRVGRLGLVDVYWDRRALFPAIAIVLGVWASVQLLIAASELARGHVLAWNGDWSSRGASVMLGALLAQLLGNALVEETIFRGFFLPQLARRFRRLISSRTGLITAALVASQAVFSLSHIPNRIVAGMPLAGFAPDLLGVFAAGAALAGVFLITRNLWVVVGLHALGNRPTALFATSALTQHLALLTLTIAVLAAWRPGERWVRRRLTAASAHSEGPVGQS